MPRTSPYADLLIGMASWFLFWGTNQVMFQWLVVEGLAAPPTLVGTAQMSMMLPSLFFLLIGGATADRFDPRRVLITVHLGTAAAVAILGLFVAASTYAYPGLVAYALAIGTFQAFGMPARDTQLSDVVTRGGLSRAVAGLTMAQHGAQMTGAFLGGLASFVGAAPVLAWQAFVLVAGTLSVARLPGRRRDPNHVHPPLHVRDLRAGIAEVLRSETLRPVFFLAVSTGTFFIGPFLVILPLIVRDVYHGGAGEMGILTAMFPLGAVLGGGVIVSRGGIDRNGRALVIGQILGASSLAAIGMGLPFYGSVAAVLVWGISGALFINTGRTIFQKEASSEHRARVLSVYTLGLMGASPFGSMLSGTLAEPIGLHGTFLVSAGSALIVTALVASLTRLWSVR